MESKKNPKADLTRKTGLFFSIALLITMSFVLFAFELKQHEEKIDDIASHRFDNFEDPMEVVSTEIIPPPPVVVAPIIEEVSDDELIEDTPDVIIDVLTTETAVLPVIEVVAADPEEVTDLPFDIVEDPASPKNGLLAFYQALGEKMKYPNQARRMGIEGKVFVEFIVDRNGLFTDLKVIKGIGGGCDEEAVRVLQTVPAWNPGKQRGKAVRQKMVLPVTFRLN